MKNYSPAEMVEHTFSGLPDDLLEFRRTDLVARCRAVQAHGWDDYRYTWSSGEVAAVAYLLNSKEVLVDVAETNDAVLRTWAYSLWGRRGGEPDSAAGCPRTRRWFQETRDAIEDRNVERPA